VIRDLQVLSLFLAFGVVGIVAWRRGKADLSASERRTLRLTSLLTIAVAAGVLPALLFPSATWLHMAGSIISILLTATAVVQMRRPLSSPQPD
jgi:heme A synthase